MAKKVKNKCIKFNDTLLKYTSKVERPNWHQIISWMSDGYYQQCKSKFIQNTDVKLLL